MKFPLSWLEDFMDVDKDVQTYVDTLNTIGLEVEGVDIPGKEISGVITVKVEATQPHPNADKLKLVDIDTGSEKKQIVCGAPNVRAGLTVPYAPSGATLPGGFTLSEKEIRGIVSDGMLCSPRELNLGDSQDGILELDDSIAAGKDICEVLGLNDPIIEISITPNRPDAMSIYGIAKELCAAFDQEFKAPNFDNFLDDIVIDDSLPEPKIKIEDDEKCPRLVGRTLSVEIGESPEFIKRRLTAAGIRTISNVVDVTNYVLVEYGRPLHSFDLDKLGSAEIIARRAKDGEEIVILDGTTKVLHDNDLLICNKDSVPVAIAGVMGGESTGVDENTKNIFLESAYFNSASISKTSKRLGLRSESSARFERGIDPNFTANGAHRAIQLLTKYANAKVSKKEHDEYKLEIKPVNIHLRFARVTRILGMEISKDKIIEALTPLVISVKESGDGVDVIAPTSRPDLTREIDLIEEVARRIGYDKFESTTPAINVQVGHLNRVQKLQRKLEDMLVGAGFNEAYTLPLEAVSTFEEYGYSENELVRTKNALRADASILRPQILPGLFKTCENNIAKGITDLKLFEIGHVFNLPFENFQPNEKNHLAIVFAGGQDSRPNSTRREFDVFDAMDITRNVISTLKLNKPKFEPSLQKGFHPTRSVKIIIDDTEVGFVGQILGEGNLFGVEFELGKLFNCDSKVVMYEALSNFPYLSFDLAFVVDENISVDKLQNVIVDNGDGLIEEINCFDIYQGSSLADTEKSVAFALRVRSKDSTMSDEDQAKLRAQIINAVEKELGGKLR
jgi:phenylalanyl-tRNA synthetase beta chain